MKVCMVGFRVDASTVPGGDTIQILQTQRHLKDLGVDVEVHSGEDVPARDEYDLVHAFNLHVPAAVLRFERWAHEKGIPVLLSPVFWDLMDFRCEVAIMTTRRWRLVESVVGRFLARRLYGPWQERKSYYRELWQLHRKVLSDGEHLLPNSHSEVTMLQDLFHLDGELARRSTVIPNAVDANLFRNIHFPSGAVYQEYGLQDYVLQVGRIEPIKNPLGLIKALYDVPGPLVFVGMPSPYHPEYVRRCRELGTQRGNTLFIDHLPHEELPAVYATAAVHVMPSWRETPGLSSLEAAAAGCRVVTTSIGCAKEYFGNQACYCHPRDVQSIRHAVLEALATPADEDLRRRVLEEYTWETASTRTLEAYRLVLNGRSP